MISRLTASAALFAILATAGLGFAAEAQQRPAARQAASRRIDADGHAADRGDHRQAPRRAPEFRPARCRPAPGAAKACIFNGARSQPPAPARQADSLPRRLTRNLGQRCSRYRARYRNERVGAPAGGSLATLRTSGHSAS